MVFPAFVRGIGSRGSFGAALTSTLEAEVANFKCMFVRSNMTGMHVDLNLLKALDALLEEGSVVGAADRLHLTQPAMSRALARIRRVMNDQVLVRSGHTMTPTPRAVAVREQVHALVQQAQAILAPEHEIDLTTIERTFTLSWHDAITTAIGPRVLAAITRQAPGIRMRMLAESSTDTSDLRHGRVDLEIGAAIPDQSDITHTTVAHDRLVVVTRRDHPITELTLESYTGAQHLTVSRRGGLHDRIDDLLSEHGRHRDVVAAVPTSTSALHFVRHSDLLVVVPESMSRPIIEDLDLLVRPLPLDLAPVPVIMAWHQRYDGDHAHAWLRVQAAAALEQVCLDPSSHSL
ncbi:LysR family transcriptional regulator [Nocardia sp. NPDC088792]|uniref:LysR family transcriptional regulator n=1 Tax=Nocardia sp. NPDC088792 TaxID=3364332 RepID=UPI00382A9F3A